MKLIIKKHLWQCSVRLFEIARKKIIFCLYLFLIKIYNMEHMLIAAIKKKKTIIEYFNKKASYQIKLRETYIDCLCWDEIDSLKSVQLCVTIVECQIGSCFSF